MNRIELEKEIRDLGGAVEPVRRKGEHRYSHPLMPDNFIINARRKDASKKAESWLRKLKANVTTAAPPKCLNAMCRTFAVNGKFVIQHATLCQYRWL